MLCLCKASKFVKLITMSKKRFNEMNCAVAQSLEAIGDWWSLLIIREALFGTTRFSDFSKILGISTNILTNRLAHLVEHEILQRVDIGADGKRYEYRLTRKGASLGTAILALQQWSDRWICGKGNEPVVLFDAESGAQIPQLSLKNADGTPYNSSNIVAKAGPGANDATRRRYEAVPSPWKIFPENSDK